MSAFVPSFSLSLRTSFCQNRHAESSTKLISFSQTSKFSRARIMTNMTMNELDNDLSVQTYDDEQQQYDQDDYPSQSTDFDDIDGSSASSSVTTSSSSSSLDDGHQSQQLQDSPPSEDRKLFVGNLSWGINDMSLGAAFESFGTVIDARVITDRFSGKSRGFGFIEFDNGSSADKALVDMNGVELDGRPIRVDRANKRTGNQRRERY